MNQNILKATAALLVLGGLVYGGFYYGAKFGGEKAVQAMRAMVVTPYVRTGLPTVMDMTQNTRFIATVKPLNTVDVKTQVAGTIEDVLFTDGQLVHEGETLFTIEDERYQANVLAGKASLTKAEADLKQVTNDYKRQQELYKDKVVSTADLEKAESRMAQAEAAVQQAKAALELAEIDLKHTEIKSPIDGRIGQVLITKGNYVTLNTPALARIVQTTPVKIVFSLNDKEYLMMRKILSSEGNLGRNSTLEIELSDKTILPLPATKVFIDNEMDKATASIGLYVEYDNADELLIPNNVVTVLLKSDEKRPVILVPQTAVYTDGNGAYVMRVMENDKVEQRYVKKGQTMGDDVEIESGLTAKDMIVMVGGQKLKSGQDIHVISTEVK